MECDIEFAKTLMVTQKYKSLPKCEQNMSFPMNDICTVFLEKIFNHHRGRKHLEQPSSRHIRFNRMY